MPIIATRHTDGTETYRLGKPDRVRNGVALYCGLFDLKDAECNRMAKSLGLVRIGRFDFNWLSYWYAKASWPQSWFLKAWFWQGWEQARRTLIREVLGRHLYLVDWSPMQRGYCYTWHECFKPFVWARRFAHWWTTNTTTEALSRDDG